MDRKITADKIKLNPNKIPSEVIAKALVKKKFQFKILYLADGLRIPWEPKDKTLKKAL